MAYNPYQTNQSVSGAVTAQAGSVLAVTGTVTTSAGSILSITQPAGSVTGVRTDSASVITTQPAGSIMAVTVSGSAGNSSVMLLNSTTVIGSVAALQGTNPWTIVHPAASVTSITIPAGSVTAVSATAPAGSIMSVTTPAGSTLAVLATQVTSPWIVAPNNSSLFALQPAGSILATSATLLPGSVSGAVTAPPGSVMTVATLAGSIMSVSATAPAGSVLTVATLAGSTMAVLATQVTSPWVVTSSNTSIVGTYQEETVGGPSVKGIALVWESNTSTSVMSTVSPTNPLRISGSVSGRVEATQPAGSLMTIITPAGSIQSITHVAGSITAVAGATTTTAGSIISATAPAGSILQVTGATTTTAGSIISATFPAGSIAAVSATAPAGSVMMTAQLAGSIMATSATLAIAAGSVMAVRTDLASVITTQIAGSILAVSGAVTAPAGSVLAITFTQSPSIYGMRNDALTSILGVDLTFRPIATDAIGRVLTSPFAGPQACIISYTGSIVSGSVQLIAASIIGSRSYITDFWLSNTGAATTLVTLQGGDTSILGQFIAPTGGGFSSPGIAIPLRTTLSQDLAFKVSPSTSVLYLGIKGYQAP